MHSFHAFIDEAGDDGFVFKTWPERASSEWFVISGLVIRATNLPAASRKFKKTLDPLEVKKTSGIHFAHLPHDARVEVVSRIAELPIKAIAVCVNKRRMRAGHTLVGNRRLYFYYTRYLLERISWIARDHRVPGEGDGTCKLIFSQCGGLSYDALGEYLKRLKQQRSQIAWHHLDTKKIHVEQHKDSIWLRAADSISSGTFQALELNAYGRCEDKYARALKPIMYCNGNNFLSYGLKLYPVPTPEAERDNRYDWLSLYRRSLG